MVIRRPRHRARAVALIIGVMIACDSPSPFEPVGAGERVPLNSEITDDVRAGMVARYSFVADSGSAYAVFLTALEGTVRLVVFDSTLQFYAGTLTAGASSPPLYENAVTLNRVPSVGGVYHIIVEALPPSSGARFRFVVFRINGSPELRSDQFVIGDTVDGETIDPIVDVDVFVAHGTAGQDIVAVAETPGPPGSGTVLVTVFDPVARWLMGYVLAEAGTTRPVTSGRIRLPATRDYQFSASSVISNQDPRYRGPYRFWTYLVNRAPEHLPANLVRNAVFLGERIDQEGDVDEFTFVANAGESFTVFLQASLGFQLEVGPQGQESAFAAATANPSDTALYSANTGRFQITQGGTYVVRISGSGSHLVSDTGSYRFLLYAMDPRPEHVPANIPTGVTVLGEQIDFPSDIDEFTFSGTAGDEFNAFLRFQGGPPDQGLLLTVLDPAGVALGYVHSVVTDTSLLDRPTGRFRLPSTGTYRLSVKNASNPWDRSRGPYQLLLYRVNRAPETLPAALTLGDSLTGETIDMPGDIDEFRVTVTDSTGATLVGRLDAAVPQYNALSIEFIDPGSAEPMAAATTGLPGVRAGTGRLRLGPGTYLVRVEGRQWEDRPVLRAPYSLWLYRFGFGAELMSDTIAVGDTVSGEGIAPWGDSDLFHFFGTRGQHVNIALQGLADTTEGGFQAWISGPANAPVWAFASVSSPPATASLRDRQTRRLDLPVTGWYHVEMTGFGATTGAYRLLIESLGSAPEHVSDALVTGDSVTSESLDTPGDWDEFTLSGAPNQDVYLLFRGMTGGNSFPSVRVSEPVTDDSLAGNVGQGERVVGPFRLSSSGQANIAVYEPGSFVRFCYDASCGGILSLVGPYAFHVVPLNRAPETAPATFAVGDTVRGEAIIPVGDLDEFSLAAAPGTSLTVNVRLTTNPVPQGGIIWLDVLDPATGTVLSTGSGLIGTGPFFSLASVVVPPSGSLLLRFRGYTQWGDGLTTAPYEFFVRP
jgi:hypothetical protein